MMNSDIKTIFKYYTINEFLFSALINNEIFFADSRNFNDPFDSRPIFSFTDDLTKGKSLFNVIQQKINLLELDIKNISRFKERKNLYEKQFDNILELILKNGELFDTSSDSNEDKLIRIYSFYNHKDIFKNSIQLDFIQLQRLMFQDLIFLLIDLNGIGVTCGSLKPDCPVMWGHYGNNHTGVCFQFEVLNDLGEDKLSYKDEVEFETSKVEYTDNPLYLFDISLDSDTTTKAQLLHTKSAKWKYESEIRLTAKKQGPLKFKREALKTVIFGAKSSTKNRYTICKLLASLGYKFEFKIARIQTDQYEMKIDEMNLSDIAGSGVHIEELGLESQYNSMMNK